MVLPDGFAGARFAVLDVAALRRGAQAPDAFDPPDGSAAPGRLTLDAYAVARLRTG